MEGTTKKEIRVRISLLGRQVFGMGLTICHTNEFVQSCFSDGFLNLRYINKMATDGGGGTVDSRHSDDCKRDIGPRLKSQPEYIFFTNFGTNSYKRIHTIVIQIV